MCKFLTGPSRQQQTDRKRMWKLLDNEVYKDVDGLLYLAPRNMYTDNYTVPMWVSWIAGSPVDFDTRCSHIHDQMCYNHQALMITLSEEELKNRGYLRYSNTNGIWVCEDVPAKYLSAKKVGILFANRMLHKCMKATKVPKLNRIIISIGVYFNIGWFLDLLTNKVFELDLNRVFEESFWREHVPQRY